MLKNTQVEYCAQIIDKDGIQNNPDNIKTILEAPQPKNAKELRSFLGQI